jgi:hypothetical protein
LPLSSQEQACVEALCAYLSQVDGKGWNIQPGPTLDDENPGRSSPEVVITDGARKAAVEVKRLGDDVTQPYAESVLSLERRLVPTRGGHYTLMPCGNLSFPLEPRMVRTIKKEIERVSADMPDGDEKPIRLARQAQLILRPCENGVILGCLHDDFAELRQAAERLSNTYGLLLDQGQMDHSFITDDAREAFIQAIVAAAATGNSQTVVWFEEWLLKRHDDNDDGVWVFGSSGAFDVQDSVAESTERMVEQVASKFRGEKWAPTQIIALDAASPHMTSERVRAVLEAFSPAELPNVDLVVLVRDGVASTVWSLERQS